MILELCYRLQSKALLKVRLTLYLFILKAIILFLSKDKYQEIIDYKTTINASTENFLTYLSTNKLKFKVQNTFKKPFFSTWYSIMKLQQ